MNIKTLDKNYEGLKETLDKIYTKIMSGSTITNSGPMSLTELGQEISGNVNAKVLANKYIKTLKEGSTSNDNLSAFVIQTESIDFATNELMDNFSSEEKSLVQNEAFQQGLDIKKILEIIGIELRDIWLKDAGLDVPTSTGGQV